MKLDRETLLPRKRAHPMVGGVILYSLPLGNDKGAGNIHKMEVVEQKRCRKPRRNTRPQQSQ
jgi:hypothetical protein